MNVVLISPLAPPAGGIATWTESYIKWMESKGNRVFVVNNAQLITHCSRMTKVLVELKRTTRIFYHTCLALKKDVDIIHINTSCSKKGVVRDYICMLICKLKKIPIVLHCHCNIEDQLSNKKISIAIFKKMLSLASNVIVLNSLSLSYVNNLGFSRVCIIPNFIEEVEQHCKVKEEVKKIVYVGNIIRRKGISEILQTAEFFPNIHFVLVGKIVDEVYSGQCSQNNVVFVGETEYKKVNEYLLDSDLFLFPTYTEGFSVSLLEAMRIGLPCITTPVGANKDMLEDGGGIIVPVKNSDEIVKAINTMMPYQVRKTMSEWSINKVRKQYLVDSVLKSLVNEYEKILEK